MKASSVLIVEDEKIVALDLALILRNLGYSIVGVVGNGLEAMENAFTQHPDIIIMDVGLLGAIDGVETARRIQEQADIPIVFLTGSYDDATIEKVKAGNPYGYILKPFDEREIKPVLEIALIRHRQENGLKKSSILNISDSYNESEERFQSLAELSPDSIVIHSDGVILFANSSAVRIFGATTQQELIGRKTLDFVHPDYHQMVLNRVRDAMEHNMSQELVEEKFLRLDGSEFYVELAASVVKYGKKRAIQAVFRDITERKNKEEILRKSESLFRQVWENSRDGMRLVDTNGIIQLANSAYCEMVGKPHYKVIGQLYSTMYSEQHQIGLLDTFRQRMDTNTIITHFEKKLRLWNGKELWLELSNSYVDTDNEKTPYLLSIIRDISERKSVEEQLNRHLQQIQIIAHLSESVNSVENIEEIYDIALHALMKTINADKTSVLLFDSNGIMQFVDSFGLSEEYKKQTTGHSPWKQNEQNAHPIFISDVENDSTMKALLPILQREGIRSLGFIPLMYQNRIIGKFMVYFKDIHQFSNDEVQVAQTIARHVAYAIGQKKSEAALMKSEADFMKNYELLKSILESPRDIIVFSLDTQYRYLAYTSSHKSTMKNIWGIDIGLGMSMLEAITDPIDRAKAKNNFDRTLLGEQLLFIEEYGDVSLSRSFWENRYSPIVSDNNTVVGLTVFVTNISERKNAEEKNRKSLMEKEALLKELHHRVKNNMQIISSLLHLQERSISDEIISVPLRESQNRVKSMALIHEQLYQSDNLSEVNINTYLRQLSSRLLRSIIGSKRNITVSIEPKQDSMVMNIDMAIPIGLILNELITNALKYAFVGRTSGSINILIEKNVNAIYRIIVQDNGIGIPVGVDIVNSETLGLQLVQSLSIQLGGEAKCISTALGTTFTITFPER